MTLPGTLRALLFVALAGALALALVPGEPPSAAPLVIGGGPPGEQGAGHVRALVHALSRSEAPPHVLRHAAAAPTLMESELLEAASTFAPLTLLGPERRPFLVPGRPEGFVQGRTATLAFQLLGDPGEQLLVRLEGEGGGADSVRVALDADGVGEGFFRIRPARAGWYDWRMVVGRSGGDDMASAPVGAWVREAAPLRLLVLAGAPTWESRFLVRALEEEGVTVALHQSVGRDLAVVAEVDRVPLTVDDFAPWDAVILLPGAPLGPQRLGSIEAYVTERGGGVAIAGAGEGAGEGGAAVLARLGAAAGVEPARSQVASGLTWTLPPEIAPLPDEPVSFTLRTFREPAPGAVVGASAGDVAAPALVLGGSSRGRAAAVGIRETWRWRMEAGRMAEHREFWRTLGEWLAGGLREEWRIVPERTHVPVGAMVAVRVLDSDGAGGGADAPTLYLSRPGGTGAAGRDAADWMAADGMAADGTPAEGVTADEGTVADGVPAGGATAPEPATGAAGRSPLPVGADGVARFVATEPGVYAFSLGDAPSTAAVSVVSVDGPDPAGWARAARAAFASGEGGGVVEADSALVLTAVLAGPARGGALRERLPLLLFLLLASLCAAEWSIRRLRGQP